MSKTPAEQDREALEFASSTIGISLEDPGAEAYLRRSFAFQTRRASLAMHELVAQLMVPFERAAAAFFRRRR